MKRIVASALCLGVALSPQLVSAKLACYPLTQIEQLLDAEYGEARHFTGSESTGIEYRLYVNAQTGTWSWVGVPAGTKVGCLIFAGRGESDVPVKTPAAPPEAQF